MLSDFGLEETTATVVVSGDVFGRLTVIATGQKPGTYKYLAICSCSCGSPPKPIRFDALRSGVTTSCGCFHKERTIKHGVTNSGHYHRWHAMMDRCYNPQCKSWSNYGGRGIKVCDRWHDAANFVADLPEGYSKFLELDRIDNDGDYEPGNIRWATRQQNTANRRTARLITFNGRTQSLSEWAEELQVHPSLIVSRIDEFGWSVERALTEPTADRTENMRRAQMLRWQGHTKKPAPTPFIEKTFPFDGADRTIAEISDLTGIDRSLLRKRICERGWSVDRATTTKPD